MKKILLIIISIAVIGIAGYVYSRVSQNDNFYVVDSYVGTVEARADIGDDWIAVAPGDTLSESYSVRTGRNSSCDIIMPDRGILRMEADSELLLKTINDEIEQIEVIRGGFLANIINKLTRDQTFEVETTTAVVAVRGTKFRMSIKNDDVTVKVQDGVTKARPNVDLSEIDDEELIEQFEEGLSVEVADYQETVITPELTAQIQESLYGHLDEFVQQAVDRTERMSEDAINRIDRMIEGAESRIADMFAETEARFGDNLGDLMDADDVDNICGIVLSEVPIEVSDMMANDRDDLDDEFSMMLDADVMRRMQDRMSNYR